MFKPSVTPCYVIIQHVNQHCECKALYCWGMCDYSSFLLVPCSCANDSISQSREHPEGFKQTWTLLPDGGITWEGTWEARTLLVGREGMLFGDPQQGVLDLTPPVEMFILLVIYSFLQYSCPSVLFRVPLQTLPPSKSVHNYGIFPTLSLWPDLNLIFFLEYLWDWFIPLI